MAPSSSSFIFHGYETPPSTTHALDFTRGNNNNNNSNSERSIDTFEHMKRMDNFGRISRKKLLREPWDHPARDSYVAEQNNATSSFATSHFLTTQREAFKNPEGEIFKKAIVARKLKAKASYNYLLNDPGRQQQQQQQPVRIQPRKWPQEVSYAPKKMTISEQAQIKSSAEMNSERLPPPSPLENPPISRKQEVSKKITETDNGVQMGRVQHTRSFPSVPFLGLQDTELHLMSQDIIDVDPKKARGIYREQALINKREFEMEALQRKRHQIRRKRQEILHQMIEEDLRKHTESVLENPHGFAPSREWAQRSLHQTSRSTDSAKSSSNNVSQGRPTTSRGTLSRMRNVETSFFKIP